MGSFGYKKVKVEDTNPSVRPILEKKKPHAIWLPLDDGPHWIGAVNRSGYSKKHFYRILATFDIRTRYVRISRTGRRNTKSGRLVQEVWWPDVHEYLVKQREREIAIQERKRHFFEVKRLLAERKAHEFIKLPPKPKTPDIWVRYPRRPTQERLFPPSHCPNCGVCLFPGMVPEKKPSTPPSDELSTQEHS
jgi:hypothetical protein